MELDEENQAISLGGGIDTGTGLFGSLGYSESQLPGPWAERFPRRQW
ncbi:MAG: hypothetical protein R2857_01350 [Vampirovibrionales bacterium]